MAAYDLIIGGRSVSTWPRENLRWEHRWPLGCWEASWVLHIPRGATLRELTRGASVLISRAGLPVWRGFLGEPNRDTGEMTAHGLARQAEGRAVVETNLANAIGTANGNGVTTWTLPISLPQQDLTHTLGDQYPYLSELLDRLPGRWGVDARRRLFLSATDPTTPRWAVAPGSLAVALPASDDNYVTRLVGDVITGQDSSGNPTAWSRVEVEDTAASARWGRVERSVDMSPAGVITTSRGQSILAAMLADGRARPVFSGSIEVPAIKLLTIASQPVCNTSQVIAGTMIRQHGVYTPDTRLSFDGHTDWVIGASEHREDDPAVTLTPLGAPPRTESDYLAVQPRLEVKSNAA